METLESVIWKQNTSDGITEKPIILNTYWPILLGYSQSISVGGIAQSRNAHLPPVRRNGCDFRQYTRVFLTLNCFRMFVSLSNSSNTDAIFCIMCWKKTQASNSVRSGVWMKTRGNVKEIFPLLNSQYIESTGAARPSHNCAAQSVWWYAQTTLAPV